MNKIFKDNKNKSSWGRIYISDNNKKVIIIWCATENYIEDSNITPEKLEEKIKNKWNEISKNDSNFFNQEVYYDVYFNDPKDEIKTLEFLKSIKP